SSIGAATASDYILPELKYPECFCISLFAITVAFLEHIHEGNAGLIQADAVPLRNETIGSVVDDLVRPGYGCLILSLYSVHFCELVLNRALDDPAGQRRFDRQVFSGKK